MIRKLWRPLALIITGLVLIFAGPPAAHATPQPAAQPICYGQNIWHSSSSQVSSSYVDHPNSPPKLINRGAWSYGYYATYIYRKLGYKLRLWRQDTNQTMTWTATDSIGYVPMPLWAKACTGYVYTLHFIHYR